MNIELNTTFMPEIKRLMEVFHANDHRHLINILFSYAVKMILTPREWPPMPYQDYWHGEDNDDEGIEKHKMYLERDSMARKAHAGKD